MEESVSNALLFDSIHCYLIPSSDCFACANKCQLLLGVILINTITAIFVLSGGSSYYLRLQRSLSSTHVVIFLAVVLVYTAFNSSDVLISKEIDIKIKCPLSMSY